MFRTWFSSFWRRNKKSIIRGLEIFGGLILVAYAAGRGLTMLSSTNVEDSKEVYKPQKTVISGGNLSEEKFEEQNSLVKSFVDYCNEQNYEEAYNLLTKECKEKMYPSLSDFEDEYCKVIFTEDREYNLQSWINEGNYNTYKVRFTGDIIGSGSYDDSEKYEDYITIVTNGEEQRLNINGYIKTEEVNKITKADGIEIEVVKADTYLNYVVYYLNVKNKTDKDILLDDLSNNNTIKLGVSNGADYRLNTINLNNVKLIVSANGSKKITLNFNKQYLPDLYGKSIKFTKVITNYDNYLKNSKDYTDYGSIDVKL